MSDKIRIDLEYREPKYGFFSSVDPTIDVTVTLHGINESIRTNCVQVTFEGEVHGKHTSRRSKESGTQTIHHEQRLLPLRGISTTSQTVKIECQFEFPPIQDANLPSSCESNGDHIIAYCLCARVLSDEDPVKCPAVTKIILYQGQSKHILQHPGSKHVTLMRPGTFKCKLRPFYFDWKVLALVPSTPVKLHSHTRTVRNLLPGRFRQKDWKIQHKTVSLKCVFYANKYIDILKPLSQQLKFWLRIKTLTLVPDFTFNGESTGLGKFDIREFAAYLKSEVETKVDGTSTTYKVSQTLYDKNFDPGERGFDVSDFSYGKRINAALLKFGPGILGDEPLIELLDHPCLLLCTGKGFNCTSRVSFKLVVASANTDEDLQCTFEGDTEATLLCGRNQPVPVEASILVVE